MSLLKQHLQNIIVGWRFFSALLATGVTCSIAVAHYNSGPAVKQIESSHGSVTIRYWYVSGGLTGSSSNLLTIANRAFPNAPATSVSSKISLKHSWWSGAKIYATDDDRYLEVKLGERMSEKFFRYDVATHQLDRIDRSSIAEAHYEEQGYRDWRKNPSVIRAGRRFIGRFCYQDFLPVEKYGEPDIDDSKCARSASRNRGPVK